jgi:hypothetical protein
MPASFRIDPLNHLIFSRAWGVLTDQDLATNRHAMVLDPAFTPDSAQLYDFSEVTGIEVTPAGIRALARKSVFATTARRAIVVSNDVGYGMARMFAQLSNRDEEVFRIFRDRAEALPWLTGAP